MLTLRNKIGQMLIMGFSGSTVEATSPVVEWLTQDGLGGVLLFDQDVSTNTYDRNLKEQQQIRKLIHQLNHYATESINLPLLVAIDYEGGAIDRLKQVVGCNTTLNAKQMAQLSVDSLDKELSSMANTLKHLGFNLNFAPVVDLHMHEHQGIIGALQRSFSDDPTRVIALAQQFVNVFNEYGIVACYKHFPGHGSALGDTHEGFVDVTDTFSSAELEPYYQLVKDANQSVMIMTAHVINKHLDEQGLPATLSHDILTKLLRETIGYKGIIVSDDLQMQAITDHYSLEEALTLTINAGADMIIFANQLGAVSATELIDCIEQLVFDKKIDLLRIEEAYNRIVSLKQQIKCFATVA